MSGINDIELLVDPQSAKVGLPEASVIGSGSIATIRMTSALTSNVYGTGAVSIFGGEYLSDNGGGIVSDPDIIIVGFAPVYVNRMV